MHRLAEVWRRGGDGRSGSKTINESGGITGGEAGIRTLDRAFRPYNGLANRRLQPLGHLTAQAKCNGNQHFGDRHFALAQATVFVNPSLKKCSGNRRVSGDPVGTVLGTVDRAVKLGTNRGFGDSALGLCRDPPTWIASSAVNALTDARISPAAPPPPRIGRATRSAAFGRQGSTIGR